MKQIRILLVDDHPIVRYGMRQLIDVEEDMTVCGEAGETSEALEVIDGLGPDLAIVDISMKGRSGIELVRDLRDRSPDLPVLVLSVHQNEDYVERALKAGARGYVTKQEAPKLIVSAIRRVMGGEIFLCERMATRILSKLVGRPPSGSDGSPTALLSNREIEVFEMIGRGLGTANIAKTLSLSVHTIETYKRRIKGKLHIESASELTSFATGWLLRQS